MFSSQQLPLKIISTSRLFRFLMVWLLLTAFNLAAQSPDVADFSSRNHLLKSARRDNRKGRYEEAREKLFKLFDADTGDLAVNYELAMNYYLSPGEKSPAIPFFRRATRITNPDTLRRAYFYMADLLQNLSRYPEALYALQSADYFANNSSSDGITKAKIANLIKVCENAKGLYSLSKRQNRVTNLGPIINSAQSEYAPIFDDAETSIIFTQRKMYAKGATSSRLAQEYFEDNYKSQKIRGAYLPPQKFKFVENTTGTVKVHNSAISFSPDRKHLFTFRGQKLYVSEYKNGVWLAPVMLDNNINVGDLQTSACLSPDGQYLYFTSNNGPGGLGGLDIYRSKVLPNGDYAPAENLGPNINTPLSEESPSFNADGKIMYFSSKGHNSIGGYDIFMSAIYNGKWSEPINMGVPINSTEDDLHFVLHKSGNVGYFTSRRAGGYGESDIYKVFMLEKPNFLECQPYSNTNLLVNFDASKSVDKLGMKQFYQWEFGDGTQDAGEKVSHVFKSAGKHKVRLNVIDSVTGYVQNNEKVFDVNIKGVTHLEVMMPDTIRVGQSVLLDASGCMLKGGQIQHYTWNMGDTVIPSDTSRIMFTFEDPGAQGFRLEIIARMDSNGKLAKFCVFKNPEVWPSSGKPSGGVSSGIRKPRLGGEKSKDWFQNAFDSEAGNKPVFVDGSRGNNGFGGNKGITLKPIYFDFDDARIREDAEQDLEDNLSVLEANSNLTIRLVAHADARGKNTYNRGLSRKRAQSTVVYLRNKGFDTGRILGVVAGGEEMPLNKCFDNVECSPEDHQSNRVVEFEIVSPGIANEDGN